MVQDDKIVSVNGFAVLKVKLPSPPSFREPAWHYLYLHRHEPKIPTPDAERTLFAVNVPVDATDAHFRALFAKLSGGAIETVKLGSARANTRPTTTPAPLLKAREKNKKKRKRDEADELEDRVKLPEMWDRELQRSGSTALITFRDRAGLAATLKAVQRSHGKTLVWGEGTGQEIPVLGSQRYYMHHRLRYPPPVPLQASVDAYMTRYAALEAERARQAKRLRQEPDEEGFITVTRGGRNGPARQEEAQAAAERQKKKAEGGLKNFYRFQLREERKKAQGELLRRFEDDRRKLAEMKKKRARFRPE